MSKNKTITLKDKEVQWAVVNHTHNKFDSTEQEYSIDVILTEAEYAKLKKLGLQKELKNKNDKTFVTFQKNVLSSQGKELIKPPVFDKYGQPFEGSVGNGSICDVRISVFEYKPSKFSFKYDGLMVKDLVEFSEGGDKEGFDFEALPEDDVAPFDVDGDDSDDFDVI